MVLGRSFLYHVHNHLWHQVAAFFKVKEEEHKAASHFHQILNTDVKNVWNFSAFSTAFTTVWCCSLAEFYLYFYQAIDSEQFNLGNYAYTSVWDIFVSNIGMDSGCVMQDLCVFTQDSQENAGLDCGLAATSSIRMLV